MFVAGGTSVVWPSSATMRASPRRPPSVPAISWSPPRIVMRFMWSTGVAQITSRISTPCSLASVGAFTYVTGSSLTPPKRPFSVARVRIRVS